MLSLLENQTNSELRKGKTLDQWTYSNSGFEIDLNWQRYNFFFKIMIKNSYFRMTFCILKARKFILKYKHNYVLNFLISFTLKINQFYAPNCFWRREF